jgi:hypothetical protein
MRSRKKYRWKFLVALAALTIACVAPAIDAATVTMNPVADTFVSSASPGNNYGAAGALDVASAALPKGEFQSLLKFDLAAAKASFDAQFGAGQWQVQSVTLQCTATNPNNPIFNTPAAGQFAASWMQNDSWLEGTGTPNLPTSDGVTFSTLPTFLSPSDQALGTFTFPGGTSGNNTYTLGLASSFVADIAAGNNASIRLLAADSAVSYCIDSRNFTQAALRPLLSVEAVAIPEPAGACLFIAAAVGIACRRKVR